MSSLDLSRRVTLGANCDLILRIHKQNGTQHRGNAWFLTGKSLRIHFDFQLS